MTERNRRFDFRFPLQGQRRRRPNYGKTPRECIPEGFSRRIFSGQRSKFQGLFSENGCPRSVSDRNCDLVSGTVGKKCGTPAFLTNCFTAFPYTELVNEMKSTFRILFFARWEAEKDDGKVPLACAHHDRRGQGEVQFEDGSSGLT